MAEDIKYESKDITVILENLEGLVFCYECCRTAKGKEGIVAAFVAESGQLCNILADIVERWLKELPFLELRDFDFKTWAGRMAMLKKDTGSVIVNNTLDRLRNRLMMIDGFECNPISNKSFLELSRLVSGYYCKEEQSEAIVQTARWLRQWQVGSQTQAAVDERNGMVAKLDAHKDAPELKKYIDYTAGSTGITDSAQFGMFLFRNRRILQLKDVRYIYKLCHGIEILDKLFLTGGYVPAANGSTDRKAGILNTLYSLAERGNWRGITTEAICRGIGNALFPSPEFNDDLKDMSAQLWELLNRRRGCNAAKSLEVTWLNLVGYFVRRGFLSGGSPALCRTFFPDADEGAYKSIDKGRTGEVKVFSYLMPLLDKCFK